MASAEPEALGSMSLPGTTSSAPGRAREALCWALLAVAASPVLVDLGLHLLAYPWAAYCLVFFALFAREAWRPPAAPPTPWIAGFALVGLGMLLEVILVRAGFVRWGRPAVALAMTGMALGLGHPRGLLAWLPLLTVPLPTFVASLASPRLETGLLRGAEWLLQPLGAAFTLEPAGHQVLRVVSASGAGAAAMELHPADGGPYVAALLAGLAAYTALREGLALPAAARRMAGYALLALPIQAAFVLLAALVLHLGWPGPARLALSLGPWMLAALLVGWRHREAGSLG